MIAFLKSLRFPIWLVAFGGVLGTCVGELPEKTTIKRGEYLVLQGDLHVHTRFSDGFLSPFSVVLEARRKELDLVAVTEHNMVVPGRLARWFSKLTGGPIVLVGQEVTTKSFHLIAVGIERAIPARKGLKAALDAVHAQNGVAIAAHPVSRFWAEFDPLAKELDGAEVVHPIALRPQTDGGNWRWKEMVDFYERYPHLTAIGSSDYHFFASLGVVRTLIFVKEATPEAAMDALKKGHTVAIGPNGQMFGDADLIDLLTDDPVPAHDPTTYPARSAFDAVSRAIAWAGVLALILFRRKTD